MADNDFPFMRMGQPFQVPVSATPSQYQLPDNFFGPGGAGSGANSFLFVNPNAFWVRFAGSMGTFTPVAADTGYLFPPGFFGTFTTRFNTDASPKFLSVMAVTYQGLTAGTGICEISYGGGA